MSNLKLLQIGDRSFHIHKQTIFDDYSIKGNSKIQKFTFSPYKTSQNNQWLNNPITLTIKGAHVSMGASYNVDSVTNELRMWIGRPTMLIAYEMRNLYNHTQIGCACQSTCEGDCDLTFLQSFGVLKDVSVSSSDTSQPNDISLTVDVYDFWRELDNYSWEWETNNPSPLFQQSVYVPPEKTNINFIENNNVYTNSANGGFYNGEESYSNIYSSNLDNLFAGNKGSLIVRSKVKDSSVWLDATQRYICNLYVDANNFIAIRKTTNNNEMELVRVANGTTKSRLITSHFPLVDTVYSMSWDKISDEQKNYLNGNPEGTTLTSLNDFLGDLSSTETVIGAFNTTPTAVYNGDISDVIVSNQVITDSEMTDLNNKLYFQTLTTIDLNAIFGIDNWAWYKPDGDCVDCAKEQSNELSFDNVSVDVSVDNIAKYDGSNSYTDILTNELDTLFDGDEMTIVTRIKMDSGVWTDGALRTVLRIENTSAEYIELLKHNGNNRFRIWDNSGGVSSFLDNTPISDLDYINIGTTISRSADELKAFYYGSQVGSTLNGLGTWTGSLNLALIGALTTTPTRPHDGEINDVIISNVIATPTQMTTIDSKLDDDSLTFVDLDTIFGAGNWVWYRPNDVCEATCTEDNVDFNKMPDCDKLFNCNPCKSFYFLNWDSNIFYYDENYWNNQYNDNCNGKDGGYSVVGYTDLNKNQIINSDVGRWNAPPLSVYSFTGLPEIGTLYIDVTKKDGISFETITSSIDLAELNTLLNNNGYTGLDSSDRLIVGDVRENANSKFYRPSFILRSEIVLDVFPVWQYEEWFPGMLGIDYSQVAFRLDSGSDTSLFRVSHIHHFRRI